MDEPFELPVTYKGKELSFTSRLLVLGYTHKFSVNVKGQEPFFKPDDNGDYRALIDPSKEDEYKKIDMELLKAIAQAIEVVIR
jgi:hypothetical protein